jgi:putative flippase GtrA
MDATRLRNPLDGACRPEIEAVRGNERKRIRAGGADAVTSGAAAGGHEGRVERILRALRVLIEDGTAKRIVKWFAAGLAFMGISTLLLFALVDLLSLSVPLATLLVAELTTLLRFFVNHRWVFGLRDPTVRACTQYHVANAGAFAVWWMTANVLTILGVHYLLAGILAVACSTTFSFATNFLWIWRRRRRL